MATAKVKEKEETPEEKIKAMKKELDKKFGKGTIIGATEKPTFHESISTGSLGLDKALGIGGLPRGRVIEIYGPESSGKTTLCLHVIAEAMKKSDKRCLFVDMEHAIDTNYAEKLGVDLDRLDISQPDYGEQALEVADKLTSTGGYDVVVIDSVAALVPKAELDREMGESSMGKHALLMSQAMRKLTGIVSNSNTIFIFINQIREKIGVMFGSPETTTGGNALKFYASVRLDIRRSITKENSVYDKNDKESKIGNQVTVKVIKNKTAPPFKNCTFDVIYGIGIDKMGEILDVGVDVNIIEKNGTYFNYDGSTLGQGREAAREFLGDNPELAEKIKGKIINKMAADILDVEPAKKEEDEHTGI